MRTLAGLVLALLVSTPASATPFTWEIQGVITQPTGWPESPFGGQFRQGQHYIWTVDFDSAVPDLLPDNLLCGLYEAVTATSFTNGPVSLAETGPYSSFSINPSGQRCGYTDAHTAALYIGLSAELSLSLTMHGPFDSDALLIDPRVITQGTLFVSSRGYLLAAASVNSIRLVPQPVSVPEPASVVLLGLGMFGLWRRRRA